MRTCRRTSLPLILGLLLSTDVGATAMSVAPANSWEIGPVINGRNRSLGESFHSITKGGWGFTISQNSEPHYVTFHHGSLRGKKEIRMRFRVDGPANASIYGAKCATTSPSAVTLYFQRAGDDWATDGGRWWATFSSSPLSRPTGEKEIVASLNGNWTSVLQMSARNNPREFEAAKAYTHRVGFTFANCAGFGHGARATQPVRFVVTHFQVR